MEHERTAKENKMGSKTIKENVHKINTPIFNDTFANEGSLAEAIGVDKVQANDR